MITMDAGLMLAFMKTSGKSDGPVGEGMVGFDYPAILRGTLLGMVRGLIDQVAEEGFQGDHHFLLTFDTSQPGVVMSPQLRQRYPKEMTIILQHQFSSLGTDADSFWVTLRFSGKQEPLTVPWLALRTFADPSANFGLRFQASDDPDPESSEPTSEDEPAPPALKAVESAAPEPEERPESNVIDFGKHRRGEDGKA